MFLIKNAHVYSPENLGVRDVLVVNDRIAAVAPSLTVALPGLETIDAKGLILTPGLIDPHIHVTGGGGESGPASRVPEVMFSKLVACGTTGVIGVIDITTNGFCFSNFPALVKQAIEEKADLGRMTLSTDGNGNIPKYDETGTMRGFTTGSPASNLNALRGMVEKGGFPLETVLPFSTANIANNFTLPGKGFVKTGCDADLCLFTEELYPVHVMAKGKFLMKDKEIVVKGQYED